MTVKEKIETFHKKVKSFEYNPNEVGNGLLSDLNKYVQELRDIVGNAVSYDPDLKKGDTELYLRCFDRPLATLHEFSKKSTPEERLKMLPFIISSIDNGVDLFLTSCETANSDILFKEESQIPDVSYPHIIKEGLNPISGV